MKKLLLFAITLLLTSVVFVSCNKDEEAPDYSQTIIGTWTVTSQDTIVVPESATSTFNEIMSLALAAGLDLNDTVGTQFRAPMLAESSNEEPYGMIFSATTYLSFQGSVVDSITRAYTLNEKTLTLFVTASEPQVFSILSMNNETAIIETDALTIEMIETLYASKRSELDMIQQLMADGLIQTLKDSGFQKTVLRLNVAKSVTE